MIEQRHITCIAHDKTKFPSHTFFVDDLRYFVKLPKVMHILSTNYYMNMLKIHAIALVPQNARYPWFLGYPQVACIFGFNTSHTNFDYFGVPIFKAKSRVQYLHPIADKA